MNLSWFSTNSFASASDLLNTNTTLSTNYTGNLIDYQDIWVSNNGYEDSTGNLVDFGFYVSGLDINSYNELLKLSNQQDPNDIYCGLYVIFGYSDSAATESWITKFETAMDEGIYTFLGVETTTGTGTGATFNFTLPLGTTGSYTTGMVGVGSGGQDYELGDVCYVAGSLLGGVDSFNDAYLTVTAIGSSGEITNFTITGTFENPSYKMNTDYSKFKVGWDAGTNMLNKINISSTYTYNGLSYVLRNTFPVNEGSSNANDETKGRLKVRFLIKSPTSGSSILSNVTLNAAALGEI